jgi:hypothetical protein
MRDAEKFLLLAVGVLFLVAFINHGAFNLGSQPSGASFSVGYGGGSKPN